MEKLDIYLTRRARTKFKDSLVWRVQTDGDLRWVLDSGPRKRIHLGFDHQKAKENLDILIIASSDGFSVKS